MQVVQEFMQANGLSLLDLAGLLVGLVYIYYQFFVSWKLWVASFVMSVIYIIINIQAGLYALAGIYVYFCLAAIYGIWQWLGKRLKAKYSQKKEAAAASMPEAQDKALEVQDEAPEAVAEQPKEAAETPIRHLPAKLYLPLLATIVVLTFIMAGILHLLNEDGTRLWPDATTSAINIVAMWVLAKKYCEQWLFWIVVDIINCALYIYLGPQYIFSACLFGFYTLTCIFGYIYWLKQMRKQEAAA